MTVDLTSLAIGAVAGMVIAFLMRLNALKKLDLKLQKLGIGLGVEGFEEKEGAPGVQMGDVSGEISGDIAGRDINKNSHFYQTIEAAARDAVSSAFGETSVGPSGLQAKSRFEFRTNDPAVQQRLRGIDTNNRDWFQKYVAILASSPDFAAEVRNVRRSLEDHGWRVSSITAIDNINNGFMGEIVMTRTL